MAERGSSNGKQAAWSALLKLSCSMQGKAAIASAALVPGMMRTLVAAMAGEGAALALNQLYSLCIDSDAWQATAVVSGALPALVSLLGKGTFLAQARTLFCLNLFLRTPNNVAILVRAGAIPAAVGVLRDPSKDCSAEEVRELRGLAACALAGIIADPGEYTNFTDIRPDQLVGLNPDNKVLVAKAGAVPTLVSMLADAEIAEGALHVFVLNCLLVLARCPEGLSAFLVARGVAALSGLLRAAAQTPAQSPAQVAPAQAPVGPSPCGHAPGSAARKQLELREQAPIMAARLVCFVMERSRQARAQAKALGLHRRREVVRAAREIRSESCACVECGCMDA